MKICAIICEYNPFHNGHLYQIGEAKRITNADAILCIMSGNFVQRGEAAIMDKFVRAKHAVLGGADAVIELPTPFATSNAEIFAKGAVSVLASIPSVTHLCFGTECADAETLKATARLLNDEPVSVSERIKTLVGQGISYVKARSEAWQPYLPEKLLSLPNNILGIEYTRAVLSQNLNIEIMPIQRIGGDYADHALQEDFSSASAIRTAVKNGISLKNNLPDYVKADLPSTLNEELDVLERFALLETPVEKIAEVLDCNEGLENALKKAAENNIPLSDCMTSARYTSSRIRRIALQNLLKIDKTLIRESLHTPLYLRVLAAKKERSDLFSTISSSNLPLIIRTTDGNALTDVSARCFAVDLYAEKIHALLYGKPNEKQIFI